MQRSLIYYLIKRYKIMCKQQVRISVKNISNDHVHFERVLDTDSSVKFPYDELVDSLLFLYQGLNVKVVIEKAVHYD